MSELVLEEIVHVPKAKAWDVLVNQFGHVHEWNPNLQGSHFMNGESEGGLNCERHCDMDDKTYFKERIVDLVDQENVTIKIISSNFPMVHEMSGRYELESVSEHQTNIRIVLNVSTKPVIMVHLLKMQMRKLIKSSLIGLKYYLETGRAVDNDDFKTIRIDYKQLSPAQAFTA
ncbi:MAG: SRPBCC family protein [Balneolales bacterium]|nr:SRPBCC family protein [Balneolales bacterium]